MYNDIGETAVWNYNGISLKNPLNMAKFYEKTPFLDQRSCT